MFSLHTTPEDFKTQQISFICDLCLRKTRLKKSYDYPDAIVFERVRFQNTFRPHENEKPAFSNSSSLKSVFAKVSFPDGLVWTVGLTVEIELCFQISTVYCLRCLSIDRLHVI